MGESKDRKAGFRVLFWKLAMDICGYMHDKEQSSRVAPRRGESKICLVIVVEQFYMHDSECKSD